MDISHRRLRQQLEFARDIWPDALLSSYPGVRDASRSAYHQERPASVDAMLDTVLDSAIDVVGFVARDVYHAMLNLDAACDKLLEAIDDEVDRVFCVNPGGLPR